jgi:hypothetical protein
LFSEQLIQLFLAVSRDRIELSTRGFSVSSKGTTFSKKIRRLGPFASPAAPPVPHKLIPVVRPRVFGPKPDKRRTAWDIINDDEL